MKPDHLLRIERRLMAAEYKLDSTNTHVRRKKCDDVKPVALARYTSALNDIRSALIMVRLEAGARHPTLFAGSAGSAKSMASGTTRKQKQKGWGSHTPHGWKKDCEDRPRPPDFAGFDERFLQGRMKR